MFRITAILSISFFLLTITISAFSQSTFEKKYYINDRDTLPYNLLIPESLAENPEAWKENPVGKVTSKYPLILFLHGAGERGVDNEKHIVHIKNLFLNNKNRKKYQAFVVAPQCPDGRRWVEVNWSAESHSMPEKPSWAMKHTMDLLNDLIKKYPVDTTRIYLTGLSMGGYGTWDVMARQPEKIAAAIPICSGGDEKMAEKIKDIPVWVFHGEKDKVVSVRRSQNMVEAIKNAGGNPKYTEYKGVGQGSWIKAYNEKLLLEWMFEKKK